MKNQTYQKDRAKIIELHFIAFTYLKGLLPRTAACTLRVVFKLAQISGDWKYYRGVKKHILSKTIYMHKLRVRQRCLWE
jgi:hypothetical protein